MPISHDMTDGRRPQYVLLSDLPQEVRRAYELQQIEASGLEPGTHDEETHARFLEATPAMQAIALRKAEIARFLIKGNGSAGARLTSDLVALARARFGEEGTDKMTLRRILRAVEGIDPVNFAPALLPSFSRTGAARAAMSEEAWSLFLTIIRDAGPQFPLRQAWRDVRDLKGKRGWAWPGYQAVWRRWNALPEAQRIVARQGKDAAMKALSVPVLRDKTTIKPLEWVSLDGRTLDFWVDFGDGKVARPVMVALVDVASNFVLGYELARSENAVTTARVIRSVCEKYGIFQRLYTDNGSAFAGHLVAGGAKFKWRGKGRATPAVRPLGVCFHLGIELTFAIPKNAQAKIAERTFATLSRVIDDRPELRGAHAGHAPGASPTKEVVPVPLDVAEAIVAREVDRHNSEGGRRSQGARGRSYAQVFQDGLVGRIPTKATAAQLYYASLKYTPASVDRWGRVQIDTWAYGDPTTQSLLLPWHGKGQILVGCDPDNLGAPAVAFDDAGHLIATNIPAVSTGLYGSVEGKREAARNRKAARTAAAQAEAANNYLHDQEFAAALAALDAPSAGEAAASTTVVGARFGAPLKPTRRATAPGERAPKSALTDEMMRNLDAAIGFDAARQSGKVVR
ncbi:transposase domain-containing protein [Paracoccus sanguinis]|uniref:transposase domain-containing protein n=1 Tax=Paracoccus sanguinis TaxID=1545044 RepID=UPI00051FC00D|nr:transposase domain-containing protein [Paracoccus sanguinis]KGJ20717.1 hypothetical protein IX55_05160 [Paracoccus sanguinis]